MTARNIYQKNRLKKHKPTQSRSLEQLMTIAKMQFY